MHGVRMSPLGLHSGTDVEHTAPVQATVLLRLTASLSSLIIIIIIIIILI